MMQKIKNEETLISCRKQINDQIKMILPTFAESLNKITMNEESRICFHFEKLRVSNKSL